MDYLIYLAGPITGLTWAEATDWRKHTIDKFKDLSGYRENPNNYLAGPITGISWAEATDWRKHTIDKFKDLSGYRENPNNYVALSPLRGKEYLEKETDIKDEYDEFQLSTSKMINSRDMFDVRRSDLLIVNLLNATRVSIGTMLEIGAAYILNKPIIVIMEPPHSILTTFQDLDPNMITNIHNHSMLREQATVIVSDVDTAIHLALELLG